tara:strand:+ start:1772 stop:2467 length:696 start_codon:yes stop_codon:yes gene_type:complete
MSEEEIISLDSLKNPENINDKKVSFEIEETEETHLEYKKRLNKKVSEFTDDEKSHYNKLAGRQKRKNDKEEEITKKNEEEEKLNDEKKINMYNQLFVLKQKFPDNTNEIHIDKDMSLKILEEKKALILQIITTKNSESVVFETLLLMARSGERGLNYFGVQALDGYAENVDNQREDIIPILKEMVDLGEIDTSMMTPQLRLMIVMSSVAVKTIEQNNDKKKNQLVADNLDT